jgi:histidine triad (HIT) family protein
MGSDKDCMFCKIARGEMKAEKVAESDSFLAIKDTHPVAEGHVLVMPKQHWVTLLDIPDTYGKELVWFTKKVSEKLLEEKGVEGFNVVMNNLEVADQVVPHAHVHVIPRREGDNLKVLEEP